jgi:hypothetical protein
MTCGMLNRVASSHEDSFRPQCEQKIADSGTSDLQLGQDLRLLVGDAERVTKGVVTPGVFSPFCCPESDWLQAISENVRPAQSGSIEPPAKPSSMPSPT